MNQSVTLKSMNYKKNNDINFNSQYSKMVLKTINIKNCDLNDNDICIDLHIICEYVNFMVWLYYNLIVIQNSL